MYVFDESKLDKVLEFINRFNDENGFPPTVREICKELNIRSTATVYNHINRLREKGLLNKVANKRRAVSLRNGGTITIPLIGTVTAGQPILATENYDGFYTLPSAEFQGENLFMLAVRGDSMIEAGIFNGDKIVVRKQESAENGDIVVAMFDSDGTEDGATVKRFFRRNGKIILHPENSTMSDFVLDEESGVQILGKVIGLLRSF